jgi:hypothetical protein
MSHCSNHAAMSYLSMVAAVWYLRNHMIMIIILTIITPGVMQSPTGFCRWIAAQPIYFWDH